jgi:hypothetical protein
VPHVTVGLYADAWPAEELGARLARFPAGDVTYCYIERIGLMAYQSD